MRLTTRAACFCGAAIVATWPLVAHLHDAIPLGSEQESTVPVFSLWTLWWTADSAANGFRGYWNAPLFHPIEGTFAFSEPQTLTGLTTAPLWWMSAPPALAYNAALLGFLVLNGVFTSRLARALAVSPRMALIGGVVGGTVPFAARHLGVLPVLPLFGILWTIEGLVRFSGEGRPRDAMWSAAGFLVQVLTSQQLALLFVPFALGGVVVAWGHLRWRPKAFGWLALAWLTAAVAIYALSEPARRIRTGQGFERRYDVVQQLSAGVGDYLLRPARTLFPLPPPATLAHGDTAGLFPGGLLILLATAGAAGALKPSPQRSWMVYLTLSAVLAFVLSLGLNLSIGGWSPFAAMRALSSDVAQLRSPYRFAAVMQAVLLPLAALGLQRLESARSPILARTTLAIGLLAAIENLSIPQPLQALPITPRMTWTEWLRGQPDPIVLAHVPFPSGFHVSHYEIEASRLFTQIDHHKPIVNGYSSYFPRAYTELQVEMLRGFPSAALLCTLHREWRVNMLIVDRWWFEQHRAEMEAEEIRTFVEPIYGDTQVEVYRLAPPAARCSAREASAISGEDRR